MKDGILIHFWGGNILKVETNSKLGNMSNIEDEVRIDFERFIDSTVKDAETAIEFSEGILATMGVEPDLESILSYIVGFAYGQFVWHYRRLGIEMTNEIEKEFMELMARRAWELREAFIKVRMK